MSLSRAESFKARHSPYEIWFGTVLDVSGVAFWFRYTILHRPGLPSVCAAFAALFDPERPAARQAADSWRFTEMQFEEKEISLPAGSFGVDHARGILEDIQWNLQMEHSFPPESHVPSWMLRLPFVRTRSIVLSPFARFAGTVECGGRSLSIQGRGTWTHIFGTERVPELYWCFVPRFDNADAGMEIFAVRPKTGLPLLTFFTLRQGQTLTHTGMLRALQNKSMASFPDFRARSSGFPMLPGTEGAGSLFSMECRLAHERAASFIYVDPNSSNRYVVQSDISSAQLTLGDGQTFESKAGAQVEFHGLEPWHAGAFLDPYRKHDGV